MGETELVLEKKENPGTKKLKIPFKHSYSRHLLKRKGIEIYRNSKRILQPFSQDEVERMNWVRVNPNDFDYQKQIASILTGGKFEHSNLIKRFRSYDYLKHLGYVVARMPVTRVTNPYMKRYGFEFKIVPNKPELQHDTKMVLQSGLPPKTEVMFDIANRTLKLVGNEKCSTDFTYMEDFSSPIQEDTNYYQLDFLNAPEGKKEVLIKEMPIGVNAEERKLVCLEYGTDPYIMGFVGPTGSSKSITLHAFMDFMNNYWDVDMAHLNDWNEECFDWATTLVHDNSFSNYHNFLGMTGQPLPLVLLFPYYDGCPGEQELKGSRQSLSYYMNLNWNKLMSNYGEFTTAYEGLDFGKSLKYIDLKHFADCVSIRDYKNAIQELYEKVKSRKMAAESLNKVEAILNFILKKKITDLTLGGYSKWTVDNNGTKKTLNPLMACMYAGLIPVFSPRRLETVQMAGKQKGSVIPLIMNYLIKDTYQTKIDDDYFRNRRMYLAMDELAAISGKGVDQPLIELASRSRMYNVGMLWATQMYTQPIPEVRSNTSLLLNFGCGGKELNEMRRDGFTVPKWVDDEVETLNKKEKHECIVFPKRRKLITYCLDSGKREEEWNSPMKIRCVPPLSKHTKPGER